MILFLPLSAQDCAQNENITRFMARGKAALKVAEQPEDYKLAAAEFLKALEYDAKCPDIYYNLALCYEPMGKLDPCNYQEAISCLNTYLALQPNAENKNDIQEKIYEIEFLFEKTGNMCLNDLIGKWKFYWGGGEDDDFFDIEIYKNKDDFYVKYRGDMRINTNITIGRRNETLSNKSVLRDDYESSIIQYKDGTILFAAKPFSQSTEFHPKEGNLRRFNSGRSFYRELEYRLKMVDGMLKGERICTKLVKRSFSGESDWIIDEDCIDNCGTYPVYFVKQW